MVPSIGQRGRDRPHAWLSKPDLGLSVPPFSAGLIPYQLEQRLLGHGRVGGPGPPVSRAPHARRKQMFAEQAGRTSAAGTGAGAIGMITSSRLPASFSRSTDSAITALDSRLRQHRPSGALRCRSSGSGSCGDT
jgi:hypothetical protein